jgi:hypothetical protein
MANEDTENKRLRGTTSRSAKPLRVSSILTRASILFLQLLDFTVLRSLC